MRLVMDRLFEALTQLDMEIREQEKSLPTIRALRQLWRLEDAREHVRQAQIGLARIESDEVGMVADDKGGS